MRVPRFRIRTLMIAVAVLAVAYFCVVILCGVSLFLISPIAPTVGIAYVGTRRHRRSLDYLLAGVVGGAFTAALLLEFGPFLLEAWDPTFRFWYTPMDRDGILVLVVSAACIGNGGLIGLIACGLSEFSRRLSIRKP
jgi:hypothetical protein